jgi:hypothetical protein
MARKAVGKVSPEGKSQRPAPAAPVRDGAGPWVLNVRPDGIDFRDQMYVPTLVEVPLQRDLEDYLTLGVPILDQGRDGACTGFGLAAVAHYLLRTRKVFPDPVPISPAMLYAMARRYDEWAGEDYEGSSCRGAMKGWYKHGVCGADQWRAGPDGAPVLSQAVVADAAQRPLGAYFRVNHKNLVALHAALAEVGVLYASARVHSGWTQVGADGRIPFQEGELGGHAVAIVAYDQDGLWIQNSWGSAWGRGGCGHLSYGDWLANGSDAGLTAGFYGSAGKVAWFYEHIGAAAAYADRAQGAATGAWPGCRPFGGWSGSGSTGREASIERYSDAVARHSG